MNVKSFKPTPELTFNTVQPDWKRLNKLLKNTKTTGVCLDLKDVHHCDSAGLALLIEAKRLSRRYNKTLKIDGVSKAIFALAKFCGVEEMLWESREPIDD